MPRRWVWSFHGEGAVFDTAVFESKSSADEWITRYRLTGTLTKMPLGVSSYDWAIAEGVFMPKQDHQKTGKFIQRFSSASLEHWHYEDGRDCAGE